MKKRILAFTSLALLAAGAAQAADAPNGLLYEALGSPPNWKISGSFRIRMEGIGGQFRPNLPDGDRFLSLRTTLFAEYDTGPVRIGGELFDSRGYLEKHRTSVGTTEINTFELGQAYLGFDLDSALGLRTTSTVTVGRFTMDEGSRRLIARNQFRNTINAFTGLRFDWQDAGGDTVRLFYTLPHTRLPNEAGKIRDNDAEWDRESLHLRFFGGSFTKANVLDGTLQLYAYRLYESDTARFPTRNRRLITPGARLARAPAAGRIDWDFEGVYQTGHVRNTAGAADTKDLSVSAYFFHAEFGKTFRLPWSPRLTLQYDQASGDRSGRNTYNRFDTLFGARRGEYGPTSLYGAVQRANIRAPALRLEITPDKRWDAFAAYRPMWLLTATDSFAATGVRDAGGDSGKFAGHQIEARVRYWVVPKRARLDMGATYLIKGRFLRNAPNAPDAGDTTYGYMDLTFTF